MKLPLTDKFLLEVYNLLEGVADVFDFFTLTKGELWYPELYRLKGIYEKEKRKTKFSKFISYLKKKGYIKIKTLEQKQGILLTKKGMEKILKTKIKMKKRKKREDGKWQMVIFDIPERKRNLRDLFREILQFLGYKMLQKSIWVCPYDVLKETEGIIRQYSLDSYVRLFLIEEVEI